MSRDPSRTTRDRHRATPRLARFPRGRTSWRLPTPICTRHSACGPGRIHHAMARAYPIPEAAKLPEILRRVTATAMMMIFFLASCGSTSPEPTYDAAIQEGQTAAEELINQGASAITIALVDADRIIWSQSFGLADRETGQAPTDTTLFGLGSGGKMVGGTG